MNAEAIPKSPSPTGHCYIAQDPATLHGEPFLRDTRTSFRAVVESWQLGIKPEDIPQRLPHLKLAQVFDALAYHCDHREDIERFIEANRIPESVVDARVLPPR